MYQLPDKTWFELLKGQHLIQICTTVNQAIFHFSGNASIVAEKEFLFVGETGDRIEIELPLRDAAVFGLLEREVCRIDIRDDRQTLVVEFDTAQSLWFLSDAAYESFHVRIGGDELVI